MGEQHKNLKNCNKCLITKLLTEFCVDNSRKDGRSYCCKECERKRNQSYRKNNDRAEYQRQYHLDNREAIVTKKVKYNRERRQSDPLFSFKHRARAAIRRSFSSTGHKKSTKTENILGCTITFFKEYIECKFIDGMTWDNMSFWHLDHIIPLSSALSADDVIRLCHYTNFQPLWAIDNLKKGKKFHY